MKRSKALLLACALTACGDDGDLDPGDAGMFTLDASTPDAAPARDAESLLDARLELDAARDGALPLTLRFKARVAGEELDCSRSYAQLGKTKVEARVQDFRFFVSDVRLLSRDGREVPMQIESRGKFQSEGLALVDFTDGTGSCSIGGMEPNTIITGTVPSGDYTGLAFSTSVPAQLNHADPALAPAPLKTPGVSWDWLQGYRFFLAELRVSGVASSGDAGASQGGGHGATQAGHGLVHVGSTGCVGGVGVGFSCSKPNRNELRFASFVATQHSIAVDLAALFADVDLVSAGECHGRGEQCAAAFKALGIDQASGTPLTTQQVFRVE